MKKSKLVMVGNGMAGVRTLEELLKIAPELYDITVFGAEPHPNYNRILLSPVLAGEQTLDEIVLNSWDWYTENRITLHAGKKVVEVDRIKRVVRADDGTEEEYDRLLICTGSKPFILPVPGKDLQGVIAYRADPGTGGRCGWPGDQHQLQGRLRAGHRPGRDGRGHTPEHAAG
jgi:nitrite reductase (NADH) large subunit